MGALQVIHEVVAGLSLIVLNDETKRARVLKAHSKLEVNLRIDGDQFVVFVQVVKLDLSVLAFLGKGLSERVESELAEVLVVLGSGDALHLAAEDDLELHRRLFVLH